MSSGVNDDDDRSGSRSPALHSAAQAGSGDTVKLLLDGGAEVNAVDIINQSTPLHHAAHAGSGEVVKLLLEALSLIHI